MIISMVMVAVFAATPAVGLRAQEHEAAQLILNLEKLNQYRQILQRMYEGYQFLVNGYNKVKEVTSGNFKLHDIFLDGLYQVSPEVRKYYRIVDIIDYQLRIVKEYKSAYNRFRGSAAFTVEKMEYLASVYAGLFQDSLGNLDELLLVITARQTRMNDSERMAAIDRIADDMERKFSFLREFNTEQSLLAIQRVKDKSEALTLSNLFGIQPRP